MLYSTKLFVAVSLIVITNLNTSLAEDRIEPASDISLYESLYDAISMDNEKEVKLFVAFGADIDHRYEGAKTPLMLASNFGSIGAVRALLELGANPYLKSDEDMTAMDYADKNNDEFIVAVLKAKDISNTSENIISTDSLEDIIIAEPEVEVIEVTANLDARDIKQSPKIESIGVNAKETTSIPAIKKPIVAALPTTTEDINSKKEIRKISKFPNISGTYNAKTTAVFSNCGAFNQTIEYFAEESINTISNHGKFKISYVSPLLKCTGTARFKQDAQKVKGNYNCSYKTSTGLQGTLRMNINGKIHGSEIHMKYKGHDTTPGVSCNYDWERLLTINN